MKQSWPRSLSTNRLTHSFLSHSARKYLLSFSLGVRPKIVCIAPALPDNLIARSISGSSPEAMLESKQASAHLQQGVSSVLRVVTGDELDVLCVCVTPSLVNDAHRCNGCA